MSHVPLGLQLLLVLQVAVAMLFGGIIGIERELADKPAGLRTHMLTAGAAALLVGLSRTLVLQFGGLDAPVDADPVRIVQAIVIGVSIISAGTIFRDKNVNHVEGLTTAASLLIAASLGIAAALGQYVTGLVSALLIIAVLRLMKALDDHLNRISREKSGR